MNALLLAQQGAIQLLGATVGDKTERSQRIASIYASCYLQDSFLGSWFGLASYVGRRVNEALSSSTAGPWREMMEDGNYAIYMGIVPSWLLFRAGRPIPGPLSASFNALRLVDQRLAQPALSPAEVLACEADADAATRELARVEQEVILQPTYDALDPFYREPLRAMFGFRLGLAPTAPVLGWDNRFGAPWVAPDRVAWMNAEVLPAWRQARDRHGAIIRSECDRTRRWGGLTLAELDAVIATL